MSVIKGVMVHQREVQSCENNKVLHLYTVPLPDIHLFQGDPSLRVLV